MDSDEVNRSHEAVTDEWTRQMGKYNTSGIEKLASSFRDGQNCDCIRKDNGSFNICFKVEFQDGLAWAVRFPIPGRVMYPDEKVRREAAILAFLKERTRVPVPRLIAFGSAQDNHDPSIGPFLITEWVEGVSLGSLMEKVPQPEWGAELREDIDDGTLYKIYRQMAAVLLELSMHDFDHIGALTTVKHEDGQTSWPVTSRPMTLKMNEIEKAGYVTMNDHLLEPFGTTTEYMNNLIQQNISHLDKQRNSVDDAADARRKYILRRRVKDLIPHFVSKDYDSGPFKLFCDDLRPGNVIVKKENDEIKVVAIIDWEWAYTAPYQFAFSPPTWLILEDPTGWSTDAEVLYREKLEIFIRSLEDEEEQRAKETSSDPPAEKRMSTLMRRSVEDGKFWFGQLLHEAFNFDELVLWPNVEKYLEENGLDRIGFPEESEVEAFVDAKMKELDDYNSELQVLKGETVEDGSEGLDTAHECSG